MAPSIGVRRNRWAACASMQGYKLHTDYLNAGKPIRWSEPSQEKIVQFISFLGLLGLLYLKQN